MGARITAADVTEMSRRPLSTPFGVVTGEVIEYRVQGLRRPYYVDHWGSDWFCSCGHAPDCPHIRAAKEVESR